MYGYLSRALAPTALFLVLAGCAPTPAGPAATAPSESAAAPNYDYDVEERIAGLGIELTAPATPTANYVHAVTTGRLVFLAGKGPRDAAGALIVGKLGADLSVEEGYAAARRVAIAQLGALRAEIGDLNRVTRVVKVLGMVNAAPDFTEQSQVINGFSDLLVEVFGERGKHARSAVGMGSLPRNIACEVEVIVEIGD